MVHVFNYIGLHNAGSGLYDAQTIKIKTMEEVKEVKKEEECTCNNCGGTGFNGTAFCEECGGFGHY